MSANWRKIEVVRVTAFTYVLVAADFCPTIFDIFSEAELKQKLKVIELL